MAGLSSIAALMSLPAYPFWSLAIFAVDILIIYGLATYGGRINTVAPDEVARDPQVKAVYLGEAADA